MRVAFFTAYAALGGAEWSLLDRLASLREAYPSWDLHLITAADGPLLERASALGVSASAVPFPAEIARLGDSQHRREGSRWGLVRALLAAGPATLSYARRLRRAIEGIAPTVVHSYSLKTHLIAAWAAPRGVPVLWNLQDYPSVRPALAHLLRWSAPRASVAVCCSRSVADDVRRLCGSRIPVRVVYNAVDLDRFTPEGGTLDLDALAGLPSPVSDVVRVGILATFAHWKGHETFLRGVALLPPELEVRGYVVGGPLYETVGSQSSLDELRALARQLGIEDRVGFTGFVASPADAIRALDVVVHASTEPEPFGRVIVEAMACGRAVLASGAGGAAELISPEVDALLHPPGDADALARQLARLVRAPELRDRLGRGGVETARSRFDRARLARELAPIYRSALEEGA